MHEHRAIFSLLIITILAFMVPTLLSRVRRFTVPIVIGEIIAGIVIGTSGLDIVHPTPSLEFLAEFGFVFLMFVSGMEVNFSALIPEDVAETGRNFFRRPLVIALLGFGITLVGAFIIAVLLAERRFIQHPFIVSLILSTTSLGIVVPVLKEQGIIPTAYGQMIVTAALIADFATLVLLSLVFGFFRKSIILEILLFLTLLSIFGIALRAGVLARRLPQVKDFLENFSSATTQIRIRGSIALMVAWVALSQILGIEIILGAFLAGVIASIIVGHEEHLFREKLDALGYGFFIPIFFIMVGARFDVMVLFSTEGALLLLPVLIVAAYLIKLLPALLFRVFFSWKESLAAGFLLSSRLSLIIAASALAFQIGAIGEALHADLLLVAMVTCTFSPMLFNRCLPHVAEVTRSGIIVVGLNQLTTLLVERLLLEGEAVSVLACPDELSRTEYCKGTIRGVGDEGDYEIMAQAGASTAAALATALDDEKANLHICRMAQERFGIPVVVSRADDRSAMARLKELGVRVIQPALATAIALEGALLYPAAFDMIAEHQDNADITETTLRNPRFEGRKLKEIRLPGNVLVMGIRREGEVIVPHGDTVFRLGDIIMLLGNHDDVKQAKSLLKGLPSL
jgi:Kef-type K+ transport system membrane component KefB/Trk K+ transport system NAD-binding subunit